MKILSIVIIRRDSNNIYKGKHINIPRCFKEISFWPRRSSEHQCSRGISVTVSTSYILRFYSRIFTRNIQVADVSPYCFLPIVIKVLLYSLTSGLLITEMYCYYYYIQWSDSKCFAQIWTQSFITDKHL